MTVSLTPLSSLSPSLPAASTEAGNYSDLNGLEALKHAPPDSPATLKAVSEQVQALFLQMMLQSMREATDAQGGDSSNEISMYQDMFDKQVALTLSKRQDLGIARLFERQLGGQAAPAAATPGSTAPLRPGSSGPRAQGDGRSKPPPTAVATGEQAAQFVKQVMPTISRAAQALGVSPLGMLAQAALETGWGQRMPRTADGSPSLNLFGVKAGDGWAGARAVAETVEVSGGVATQRRTAFRAYGSIEDGVSDFARLLAKSPRYREALAAGGNPQAYVESMARSGYATDPDYGNKLNQVLNGGTLKAALNPRLASL